MSNKDSRKLLLEAFKECLSRSSIGGIDNHLKYFEFKEIENPMVTWSLNTDWYIEGELYDDNNLYLQRKVIAEFKPGDFLVIPNNLSTSLRIFSRTDQPGTCHYATLSDLLSNVESNELLNVIGHKLTQFLFVLTEFEKEILKPSLNRPIVLEPDQEVKVPNGCMGLCHTQSFWMKGGGLSLEPKPRTSRDKLPEYWFVHPNGAFVNEREDIEKIGRAHV